jgi:hypothetical protein
MKFTVAFLLTIILAYISGLFLPWWGIAISSFLVAVMVHQRAWKAFLAGFAGVLVLWMGLAWWIDTKNNGILSGKISSVLPLGGNTFYLLLLTGFTGAILSGLGALSGSFFRASGK